MLEKIKYLRMLGVTVSDIRQFQQGKRSLAQLLKEREYQLKEEEAALNRMKLVCLELKKRDWDFQTLDTGLFDLQMKVLERRGAERLKKDRTEPVIKLRRIVWFFAMCGIASLVFFPVKDVYKRQLMGLLNDIYAKGQITKDELIVYIKLLCPIAPHVCEEIWESLGGTGFLSMAKWPVYDEAKTMDSTVEVGVQVNGKLRSVVALPANCDKEEAFAIAVEDEKIVPLLEGKPIVKDVYKRQP